MADYMKRNQKLTIEERVTRILMESPEARNSDRILYKLYIKRYHPQMIDVPFAVFIDDYGMPSYESISRYRRKAQQRNEHLKATAEVTEARSEIEYEFVDYAINS